MNSISDRLARIEDRISAACDRAERDRSTLRLLAVSKGHSAAAVAEGWEAGLRHFGENYVQEWEGKAEDPKILALDGLRWHFVGHLQRNKIRFLLGRVHCIETVDRPRLATALSQRAEDRPGGGPERALLQVNLGGEASKAGFAPEHLEGALSSLLTLPGLDVQGLMAIPPKRASAEASRADHRALRTLRDRLQDQSGRALPELSMGMSSDFEVAIEEGSTEIRLGTALFGPRPPRTGP